MDGNGTAAAAAAAAGPHIGAADGADVHPRAAEAAETAETAVVLWKFANPYLDTRQVRPH